MTVIEKLENNIAEVNSAFQNIKSKIASHGVEVADELRPSEYAPKVDDVYDAGKKAEYDYFWDKFQKNGTRAQYQYGFSGRGWDDELFKPKYDIISQNSVGVFYHCNITDLEARLKECGVTYDISGSTNYTGMFGGTTITIIPELVFSGKASYIGPMFAESRKLHTIRKITLQEGFNTPMPDAFLNCIALENITFEGFIPKSIILSESAKLSKASIINIIEHLSDVAVSGQSAAFSKTAVNTAFETTAGAGDGSTSAEWQSLIATKSNWTISLV